MQRKKSKRPQWPLGRSGIHMTAFGNGQWGKRIRGKIHYFGVWSDPPTALERYRTEYPEIQKTGQRGTTGVSVDELVNLFLDAKESRVLAGELSARTYADYRAVCATIKRVFGANRHVADLGPRDFATLRGKLVSGPVRMGNEITWIRSVFIWAHASKMIPAPMQFGPDFTKPPAKLARKLRREKRRRLYTARQVRQLVRAAPHPVRAMILLAINGGFGNTDCAQLPRKAVNFKAGIIDYPRHKTEVERVVPLWRETLVALRRADAARKNERDGLFFVTAKGNAWIRERLTEKTNVIMDAVAGEFGKVCGAAGVTNLGFYALRHTFRTIADAARDQHAVYRIMGQTLPGMAGVYVEDVSLDRLRAVTDFVRAWFKRGACREGDDEKLAGGRDSSAARLPPPNAAP